MSLKILLPFLKALLPTKRIAAWVLGVIGAALALFFGVNNSELKAQFCASETVNLPKVEAQDPALKDLPPAPVEEKKK